MPNHNTQQEDYQSLIENDYAFKLGIYLKEGWNIMKQHTSSFMEFTLQIAIMLIFFYAFFIYVFGYTHVGLLFQYTHLTKPFFMFLVITVLGPAYNIIVYIFACGYFSAADAIYHKEDFVFANFFQAWVHWKQLFAYQLLNGLIVALINLPILIFVITQIYFPFFKGKNINFESMENAMPYIYLLMVPTYYIIMSYSFAPFLIMFGKLGYWDAMKISHKMISKHFMKFALFYVILGIFVHLGLFAFLIGSLFTIPLAACIMYAAYQDIIGKKISTTNE